MVERRGIMAAMTVVANMLKYADELMVGGSFSEAKRVCANAQEILTVLCADMQEAGPLEESTFQSP